MPPPPPSSATTEHRKPTMLESLRETVDSVVIAFVLAFLFRTFEAEAFVIPTGSMALTLMGAHKDLVCSQCGYVHRAGASSEAPNSPGEQAAFNADPGGWRREHAVVSSVCPNCRYRMRYDELRGGAPTPPTYDGDRILVAKYSYEFGEPRRWDVAVFKNPSQAKINYIKRVVGLPGEEVLIYRGDVYVRRGADEPFRMARKSHEKAAAMAQTVYDHDHVLPKIHERGWPQRWQSELRPRSTETYWKQSADLKSFRTDGNSADEAWLRYRHFVPTSADWSVLESHSLDPSQRARVRPQLITDFCEYNTERTREYEIMCARRGNGNTDVSYLGLHWVGDVGMECELELHERSADDAEAVLEIVEGGRTYQCRIRAASGDVELRIDGLDDFRPKAAGAVGTGARRLRFANVDDRLLLWVDGRPVKFDANTNFQSVVKIAASDARGDSVEVTFDGECAPHHPLENLTPTKLDLHSPVGIGVRGVEATASHLRIFRDVHYVADSSTARSDWIPPETLSPVRDYRTDVFTKFVQERAARQLTPLPAGRSPWNETLLADFMSDVETYPERFTAASYVHFTMDEGQYFVLGDNSPRSLDGRLWDPEESYVKRELLIGKALFVYWPHALSSIPGTGIPFPFFPNFGRMRMIR